MAHTLEITRPDDWHVHLRDGAALCDLVPATASIMRRALVMPNLVPPVTTTERALSYRQRILSHAPADFEPLMTLYLTDSTTPDEVRRAKASGTIPAFKLYPAGATTNSDAGVTALERTYDALEAMADASMVLCVHGEVTRDGIDVFDRERVFVEEVATALVARFPTLRIVLEHITTGEAARFVAEGPKTVAATITPQHLLANRNDMLVGGIRPHYYCLPILKSESDRRALLDLVVSGHPRVFLGTDSAPHAVHRKETACGCAGCFTAPYALELYAEAFESVDALPNLEAFAAFNGPDFYGLPRNTERITLERRPRVIADVHALGEASVTPWRAGASTPWTAQPGK